MLTNVLSKERANYLSGSQHDDTEDAQAEHNIE